MGNIVVSKRLKQFILNNQDLINDFDEHATLVQNAVEELIDSDITTLHEILKIIDVNLDEYRWNFFDFILLNYIDSFKSQPKEDDPSNSWSRLNYILYGIGNHGFKEKEIIEHLSDPVNANRLNIKLSPLEPEYSWTGPGDYDLGWFDKNKYRELYPEEFKD